MKNILYALVFLFPLFSHAWELPGVGEFHFEQVNDGVYVMHGPLGEPSRENQGFMNNPGFVLAEQGIIVVDPGGTYPVGKQVLAEIGKITDRPVIAVFNTHIHGDHWLANQAVIEAYPGIRIYAHPDMIAQATGSEGVVWVDMMERLTEGLSRGTEIVAPEHAVVHSEEITIGGQHFRIHSFPPTHTDTDIMIEHVESSTLFMGDNGFNRRMARFDDSSSMHGNIEILDYAAKLNMKVYVPGHGPSGTSAEVIRPFQDYLLRIQQIVKQGFDDGLENYEIKEIALDQVKEYQGWANFDTNFGKHISKMYLEIERREL